MTYPELLRALFEARRLGMDLGLDRVRDVLARLGDPQRRMGTVVHVGDTNGKGSVGAFVEAIARATGASTAVFSSPHLSRLAERFRVDGAPVDDDVVLAAGQAVLDAQGDTPLTFFEQVTAIAFRVFAEAQVDVSVIEVGMGGRLDSTNVVDPAAAVVTGVALDHTQFLGDTLPAIAREKAGIFKPGRPAIVGRCGVADMTVVLATLAAKAGATPVVVADAACDADLALGLAGPHQRANAAVAIAVARQLGWSDTATREGLAAARLPGRLERVADEPPTWIDGAHNPHAAAVVAGAVPSRTRVLAVSKGKDVAGLVGILATGAARIIATEAGGDRAESADAVAAAAREAAPDAIVEVEPDAARAFAASAAGPGPVLVAGSLFLAGLARQYFCGDPADPVALRDPVYLPT